MGKIDLKDVSQYVEHNIGIFHKKRIQSLDNLKLSKVLKRKNPYLFKAVAMVRIIALTKAITLNFAVRDSGNLFQVIRNFIRKSLNHLDIRLKRKMMIF